MTFDPWPQKSNQLILGSKGIFVPNLTKFPQSVREITLSQDGQTDNLNMTLALAIVAPHKNTKHTCAQCTQPALRQQLQVLKWPLESESLTVEEEDKASRARKWG